MLIEKQQVIEFLEARGDKEAAERAEHDLPDPVETDENADMLAMLGIDEEDLTGGFGTDDIGERLPSDPEEGA